MRRMGTIGRRVRWAALVASAAVCAACGGSNGPKLPLSAYLVRGQEETGMRPSGAPTVFRNPANWTSGVPDAATEDNRLGHEGFREVLSLQTGSGVSWVMLLGSASATSREEAAELQSFVKGSGAPPGTTRFTVAGVPTADGFEYPGSDANILFTEGRCLLLVGDDLTVNNQPPVIAGVRAIWARTHGKAGACSA
jgi:hypothetical protein